MKYTDILAKPVPLPPKNLLLAEALRGESKLLDATYSKVYTKVPALFAAHGIKLGNWEGLALALAQTHVPGFRVVSRAGRPTEWGVFEKAELKLDVDDMQEANPGMPATEAMRKVCRLSRWEVKAKGMKVTALRKHYDDADLGFVAMVRDARAYQLIVQGD